MARNTPLGVGSQEPGNISNTAELPYLRRGKLKTIKKKATRLAPSAATTGSAGAPKVDTFARDTVPNVTYSTMPRS